MLDLLKKNANITRTMNGAVTYSSSLDQCLDLFFAAGAMRDRSEKDIADAVIRAYNEDSATAMKIIFFARDVRGGLGERRFFRAAVKALACAEPRAVIRNIRYFGEFGRFDDLCVLIGTPCEAAAVNEIRRQLDEDVAAMKNGGQVSLLAKWLPSVNASAKQTVMLGKRLAALLGMSQQDYRRTLSSLRKYTDIIENRLRISDYSFDYSKQPSRAMFKYRNAFIRNDGVRYRAFVNDVIGGKRVMNASALFPYDIVRSCGRRLSDEERLSLDAAWRSLPVYGNKSGNAIAVIDGSGSMTWCPNGGVRPIDAALSLGIYFAEHNTGAFANHFITFSEKPQIVEVKGHDIASKVRYCASYNEVANTDLEAVFRLILDTAVKNKVPQKELPETLYIISDMEFDRCVIGGNRLSLFRTMERLFKAKGYRLPKVVFWNVNSFRNNCPVTASETGAALVSGFSPSLFDMVMSEDVTPMRVMMDAVGGKRYAKIA